MIISEKDHVISKKDNEIKLLKEQLAQKSWYRSVNFKTIINKTTESRSAVLLIIFFNALLYYGFYIPLKAVMCGCFHWKMIRSNDRELYKDYVVWKILEVITNFLKLGLAHRLSLLLEQYLREKYTFSIRYPSFCFFNNLFLCSITKFFIQTVHLAILVLW